MSSVLYCTKPSHNSERATYAPRSGTIILTLTNVKILPASQHQLEATLLSMSQHHLGPELHYFIFLAGQETTTTISLFKHRTLEVVPISRKYFDKTRLQSCLFLMAYHRFFKLTPSAFHSALYYLGYSQPTYGGGRHR